MPVKDLWRRMPYSVAMKLNEPLHLDVCPILASGRDPFAAIMAAKDQLQPGQNFVLTVPFEPVPLYEVFRNQGFEVKAKQDSQGLWTITFVPQPSAAGECPDNLNLDLRDVPPPEPLKRAMEAASMLGRGETLSVRTRFRPVYLLEQLDERGFDAESVEEGPEDWITHIWRITT